jgi:hypothetical protein
VGNSGSNFLWLSADQGIVAPTAGIQQWRDRSGNGNHASQATPASQPFLVSNVFNGQPAVLFDNDATNVDRLTIPDNSTLEGMGQLTGFVVFRLNAGTPTSAARGFLSKRLNPSSQNAYGWFLWHNGSNVSQYLDIDGSSDRAVSTNHFAANQDYLNGFIYHGTAPSDANDQQLFTNNGPVGGRAETSSSVPNYSSDLHIGTLFGHGGTRFNGYIAEVILFNIALNTTQRAIVSNHLAAKYGLALAGMDVYTMDELANGNFDHEVGGIGRTTASDLHSESQTGVVRIGGASGLGNNEYLLWGHDNGALGTWGVSDLPAGVEGRWERVWRVSEVNSSGAAVDVGQVDITFDLNDLGPVSVGDLRLLVDSDMDGSFADEVPIGGAMDVGSGLYRFSGVSALVNGVRFTLGTTDRMQTPLPITLIDFHALSTSAGVDLFWSTASEVNNARFTVERSEDMEHWEAVIDMPGAGTSYSTLHYQARDERPLPGTSYYRLRQTDLDGASSYSAVRAVAYTPSGALERWPVPTADHLWVRSPEEGISAVELFTTAGQQVRPPVQLHGPSAMIDLSGLKPGAYVVQVHTLSGTYREQVLKAAP